MENTSLVIKVSQNERYCFKCKKVKNEIEFDKPSPFNKHLVLKSIENTISSGPANQLLCKECADIKSKVTIDLSQNEKYCSGCKSVKDQKSFSNNQDWCKECKSRLMKKYYEKNGDHHRATVHKNYQSKRVNFVCECGRTISLVSLKAHLKTKLHSQMLEIKQLVQK